MFIKLRIVTVMCGPVAQWIRRWSSEPKIVGSSPTGVKSYFDFPKVKSEGCGNRAHPGSNQGPADLQSAALPLSYTPYHCNYLKVLAYVRAVHCSNCAFVFLHGLA